jgi:phage tail-like protein
MRLTPDAATLWMRGLPHWRRCAFDGVALLGDDLVLAPDPHAPAPDWPVESARRFTGMAFDARCRLFRAMPLDTPADPASEGTSALAYVIWGQTTALGVHDATVHPLNVTAARTEGAPVPDGGAGSDDTLPRHAVAVGVDSRDLLYATDPVERVVWVIDTWQREVARRIPFTTVPLDVAVCGDAVFVLTDDGQVWRVSPCDAPEPMPWPRRAGAARLTVSRAVQARDAGAVAGGSAGGWLAWVLIEPGAALSRVQALHNGSAITVADALDLVSGEDDARLGTPLTLAMQPGQDFVQLRWLGAQPTVQGAGLSAPGYDGTGITLAPDGRIAYWTSAGLRHTSPARSRYRTQGRVFGFALDSGHDQRSWGAVRVMACVPPGTELRVWTVTRDELDDLDSLPHTPPVGALADFTAVPEPERTPLMSAQDWARQPEGGHRVFRDAHAPALSGPDAPEAGLQWFEVPVMAPPGRYLWVVLALHGTRHKSPRVRAVQVAHPGHRWLQQLPRTLWHEPAARDFLHRYLMPLARVLDDWDRSGAERHRLLNPRATPGEALPWLGRFVGLAMDPCWSETVQRRMVGEAARLFRTRGTVASLRRMVSILTEGAEVVLIEHHRLRGGGVVGHEQARASQAVLGAGFRVGGLIGEPNERPLADTTPVRFDDFAHRFTVMVVARLTEAQRACVERLIELHKPAHTAFTLCTAEGGLRLGVGSHVGVSAVVGHAARMQPAITGEAALGQGFILGRPELPREPIA